MSISVSSLIARDLPTYTSLFPFNKKSSDATWSTFQGKDVETPYNLSVDALRPVGYSKRFPIVIANAPDGKAGIKVHFPKGTFRLSGDSPSGLSFYTTFPGEDGFTAKLESAREASFGYSVYIPDNFEFALGGKLPGFYGGESEEVARGCSGGRQDSNCFSARMMWREKGAGEVYLYLPPYNQTGFEANKLLCQRTGNFCDPTFGISVGQGTFTFPKGEWTTIAQRIRLNDVGEANGEIEVAVNGKGVIGAKGVIFRGKEESRIRGGQIQSFFGGSTKEWATPQDQEIYLADFSASVISGTTSNLSTNKGFAFVIVSSFLACILSVS